MFNLNLYRDISFQTFLYSKTWYAAVYKWKTEILYRLTYVKFPLLLNDKLYFVKKQLMFHRGGSRGYYFHCVYDLYQILLEFPMDSLDLCKRCKGFTFVNIKKTLVYKLFMAHSLKWFLRHDQLGVGVIILLLTKTVNL